MVNLHAVSVFAAMSGKAVGHDGIPADAFVLSVGYPPLLFFQYVP